MSEHSDNARAIGNRVHCPDCDRSYAPTVTGLVRRHMRGARTCDGSYKRPKACTLGGAQ